MSVIDEIHKKVLENFRYTTDEEQYGLLEDWHSHLTELDEEWKDDCDGFALTCAVLALEKEIDPSLIRIIFCRVENKGEYHLVCGIDTEDDTRILDNRRTIVVSAGQLQYEWISSMRLSEPGVWTEMI